MNDFEVYMALIFWKLSEKINSEVDPPQNRSHLATQFFSGHKDYILGHKDYLIRSIVLFWVS